MLHSVIGTNFPLPCQKMDQFHYHLPYSPVTSLTELFQLLSYMVPNNEHNPSCRQAAAQQFDKISHFLTNIKAPFMFTKTCSWSPPWQD